MHLKQNVLAGDKGLSLEDLSLVTKMVDSWKTQGGATPKDLQNFEITRTIALAKSKDPHTKVGCMVVGPEGEPRSWGYNGMPRGCDDTNPRRLQRPEKYFWFEHAERNALYNAARTGISLLGCTLIATMHPCMDCARGIVQVGITKVICPKLRDSAEPIWKDQVGRVLELFNEVGVEVVYV